jgi:hypothetical protein
MLSLRTTGRPRSGLALAVLLPLLILAAGTRPEAATAATADTEIALSLAELMRSARSVIATQQERINDPTVGDKGLSGEVVLAKALEIYRTRTGRDPRKVSAKTQHGRLLRAQMAAIREVMDENQKTINRKGLGLKGFVPAVFTRLVNERFGQKVGQEATIKVTAPPNLVRNRKALPDPWEAAVIRDRLMSPDWPSGEVLSARVSQDGREALRVLVPEYYGAGCLACHGGPRGSLDVTGYPREGGQIGELGGVISITLFR